MSKKLKAGTKDDVERYAKLKEQQKALESEIDGIAAKAFHYGCKGLFEANPLLRTFSWKQYTPYFNDGEECVFSVDTDYPYVNGMSDEGGDYNDDCKILDETDYSWEEMRKPEVFKKVYGISKGDFNKLYKTVQKFLRSFDEDEMKMIFGDHVAIKVTKDSIKVEKYDHD